MSHVYCELYYHLIWSTKNRLDLIDEEIEKLLKIFISKKIRSLNGREIEFNAYIDHCHLLCSKIGRAHV